MLPLAYLLFIVVIVEIFDSWIALKYFIFTIVHISAHRAMKSKAFKTIEIVLNTKR